MLTNSQKKPKGKNIQTQVHLLLPKLRPNVTYLVHLNDSYLFEKLISVASIDVNVTLLQSGVQCVTRRGFGSLQGALGCIRPDGHFTHEGEWIGIKNGQLWRKVWWAICTLVSHYKYPFCHRRKTRTFSSCAFLNLRKKRHLSGL